MCDRHRGEAETKLNQEGKDLSPLTQTVLEIIVNIWGWLENFVYQAWSGLEWPHSVLIIFLFVVVIYKAELKALLERILELGPGGIKLQPQVVPRFIPSAPEEDGPAKKPSVDAPRVDLTPKGIPLPPFDYISEQMKLGIDLINSEISGMDDGEAKEYLIPRLALSRTYWIFESIYAQIFGGQIKFLQILNQRPGKSISQAEIYSYWALHKEQVKPVLDSWSSEQYLLYLSQNGLVFQDAAGARLTNKGVEFLLWLTHLGKPQERPW
ncbi:hypothetical protein D3C77_331040 [compost metagenome]